METKFNEATLNRPDGDRVIDAPFLFIDIEKYQRQLKEEEAWQKNDRNAITIFKSQKQTLVLAALHAGANVTNIEVKGIVTLHLIHGSADVNINAQHIALRQNQIITLHENIDYAIYAQDDSLLLITTNLS